MVTPCPLCHLSLDAWQKKAERTGPARSSTCRSCTSRSCSAPPRAIDESTLKFRRHITRLSDDVKEKLKLPSVVTGD